MPWVSEQEFRHKHALWHRSSAAREVKRRLRAKQRDRCGRCGLRYRERGVQPWQLELNLTRYWNGNKLVFDTGVKDGWAVLLCRDCHPKGTYTWEKLTRDRETDRWRRAVEWPFRAAWRAARWLFRR